jgi:hypothetical protein
MDLQVGKKGGLIRAKGEWSKSMREAKGLNQGNGTVNVFMCMFIFLVYVLSANNIDLCLGCK